MTNEPVRWKRRHQKQTAAPQKAPASVRRPPTLTLSHHGCHQHVRLRPHQAPATEANGPCSTGTVKGSQQKREHTFPEKQLHSDGMPNPPETGLGRCVPVSPEPR